MILNVTNAAARLAVEYELPQPQVQALYLQVMVMRALCHDGSHSLEHVQREGIVESIKAFVEHTGVSPERYISLVNTIQEEVEATLAVMGVIQKSSHKPARARVRRTKPHVTKDKP